MDKMTKLRKISALNYLILGTSYLVCELIVVLTSEKKLSSYYLHSISVSCLPLKEGISHYYYLLKIASFTVDHHLN
jgi:hypothetical protein